jgi:hypothetical protein
MVIPAKPVCVGSSNFLAGMKIVIDHENHLWEI